MRVVIHDINGEQHTVKCVTWELSDKELIVKDALDRAVAVFERDKIIGFETER